MQLTVEALTTVVDSLRVSNFGDKEELFGEYRNIFAVPLIFRDITYYYL